MDIALVGAELEENLAVRYLRGALEREGHWVEQIVFNSAADLERAARELAASDARIAGFSMVFTYRAREFAALMKRARELGFRGHMVAGGHFAAFHAELLLADVPALDSVACGEGEELLCELARSLDSLASVEGLVWRGDDGVAVRNTARAKQPDLDTLAHPTRRERFDRYLGVPITCLVGSRGCTHACSFCSIVAWHRLCGGDRLRLRSPSCIADEMAELAEQGVRIFNFHDDNFFLRDPVAMLERAAALRAELERRGLGRIAFAVKCRPDTMDEEVHAYLKSMGMFRLFLGIEAGTAQSLRQLGRGQTLADNERALEMVNRLDIHTCFNLLLWNPDSTLEDVADNVAFLREHPANPQSFCRTEIYAGTPLERKLRREGRLLGDYWGYDYVMADPGAQTSFEVIYPAFRARNYGDRGPHPFTMGLDYEHQLLEHFHGRHEALRRRVKQFIVIVNRNTCDLMDEALDAVARGRVSAANQATFTASLRARVEAEDQRLLAVGEVILADIREAAEAAPRAGARWVRSAAAAAGLVATVTMSSACDEPVRTHPTEMIAVPTGPASATPPPDAGSLDAGAFDASSPPDASAAPDAALEAPPGDPALIKGQLDRTVLPTLGAAVVPAQDVEVELTVDAAGKVGRVVLRKATLSAAAEKLVRARLTTLEIKEPKARGARFVVSYSAAEITAARPRPLPHPSEMAPRRTEINEMIAAPPDDDFRK